MPKITIEVSDTVYKLLQVLDEEKCVEVVVEQLIDHAQQGVYRPGAWERPWLIQVFGEDFIDRLEPGDPYGRPDSPMLQRPNSNSTMSLYWRHELTDSWTLVVCDPHVAEFGPFLHQHGFHLAGPAPKNHHACSFCLRSQGTVDDIERCTCVDSKTCPVHSKRR
jgi:hypothetical protein